MAVLRTLIGEALRTTRLRQDRTLREVSAAARVSLGYLSEVERGQKEASSELLASICRALGVRLSDVLREVSESLSALEPDPVPVPDAPVTVPDRVPAALVRAVPGGPTGRVPVGVKARVPAGAPVGIPAAVPVGVPVGVPAAVPVAVSGAPVPVAVPAAPGPVTVTLAAFEPVLREVGHEVVAAA